MPDSALARSKRIDGAIYFVRGHRVMIDSDLAALYGVTTKALNQAVRRNIERFPDDFMFKLEPRELAALNSETVVSSASHSLRSQFVTLNVRGPGRGSHRKFAFYVFTEQGIAMLSSVLRGPRAVQVNIEIMRAFVRLRRLAESHADLAQKLAQLEQKTDGRFKIVFEAIDQLIAPPLTRRRRIGFKPRGTR